MGSVCIGLANIATDGIACARLLHGEFAVPNDVYKAAYVAFLSLGVATTALSLTYRLKNARQVKGQLLELSQQRLIVSPSRARQQQQQNEWERVQTHRTITISSLALLSIAAQGAMPLLAAFGGHCNWGFGGICRLANVYH